MCLNRLLNVNHWQVMYWCYTYNSFLLIHKTRNKICKVRWGSLKQLLTLGVRQCKKYSIIEGKEINAITERGFKTRVAFKANLNQLWVQIYPKQCVSCINYLYTKRKYKLWIDLLLIKIVSFKPSCNKLIFLTFQRLF